MLRRAVFLTAVALAAGASLPPPAVAEVLSEGRVPAEGLAVPLDVAPGSYVEGALDARVPLRLHLIERNGAHRRQLTEGAGRQAFRIVTEPETLLELTGPEGTDYTLSLDRVVPVEAQTVPAEAPRSPAMTALETHLSDGGDTAAFWAARAAEGTPMIERVDGRTVMTFLYRGAERNVRLFGGPSADHDWLARLGRSDVWFRSYEVPADTRLAYRLAPDIPDIPGSARERRTSILATAAADPLNRAPWPADAPDAFNRWSTVALPGAPDQPGFPAAPSVLLEEARLDSVLLGNSRRLILWRSEDFDPADPDALLLIVFDGPRAVEEMEVPGALANLVREGRLPPVAAVFIDAIDSDTRSRELPGNPRFADFLADELLPVALDLFDLSPHPDRTVLAGASFGGIGAANAALSRPDAFGAVVSLSGSYWWAPDPQYADVLPWTARRLLTSPKHPVRFFVSAGAFETSHDGTHDINVSSRLFHAFLTAQGYETTWREYGSGHDSFVWRGALMDGLLALYGL